MRSDERETVGNLSMTDRLNGGHWRFYSDDPVLVTKLKRVCLAKEKSGAGWFFDLAQESVVFRRALSDEERAKKAKILADNIG